MLIVPVLLPTATQLSPHVRQRRKPALRNSGEGGGEITKRGEKELKSEETHTAMEISLTTCWKLDLPCMLQSLGPKVNEPSH